MVWRPPGGYFDQADEQGPPSREQVLANFDVARKYIEDQNRYGTPPGVVHTPPVYPVVPPTPPNAPQGGGPPVPPSAPDYRAKFNVEKDPLYSPTGSVFRRAVTRAQNWIRDRFVTTPLLRGKDIVAQDPVTGELRNRTDLNAKHMESIRTMASARVNKDQMAELDVTAIIGPKATPADYDAFRYLLNLEDMREDMSRGTARMIGGDLNSLHAELNKTYADVSANNPEALNMLDRHVKLMRALHDIKVTEAGMSPSGRQFYYPHQIVDYFKDAGRGSGIPAGIKTGKGPASVRYKRGGTYRDVNWNYIDVMEKALAEDYTNLSRVKTVLEMLQSADVRANPGLYLDEAGKPVVSIKGEIPKGFKYYNAMNGMQRVRATSLVERMMGEVMDMAGIDEWANTMKINRGDLGNEIARLFGSEQKFMEMVGEQQIRNKAHEYLIPEELAATLDAEVRNLNKLDRGSTFSKTTKWWKTLALNAAPFRLNLRNIYGDGERAYIQFGNEFVKELVDSRLWSDTYAYYKNKQSSPHMNAMLDNAISSSGMWAQETALSLKDPRFFELQHAQKLGKPQEMLKAGIRILKKIPEASAMREDIFRGAIYQMNMKRYANGGEMLSGIANKDMVAGLLRDDPSGSRAAALIAREALGDYGRMTMSEQKIRSGLIPFYGWLKTNSMFWGGLTKAMAEGSTQGAGARASKAALVRGAAVTMGVMASIRAWNETVHGDLEEELPESKRRTTHIILGRDDEGKVMSITMNDALDDFLSYLGADQAIPEAFAVMRGTLSAQEYANRLREDALLFGYLPGKGVVKTGLTQMGPWLQAVPILAANKRMFPDPFNPSDIPPEQKASSVRDLLAMGALPTDFPIKGQVYQPTTEFYDIPKQMGFSRTRPNSMAEEMGVMTRYENDIVRKLGLAEKNLNDLNGRYSRMRGDVSNRQLKPGQREAAVSAMEAQRNKMISEVKDLAERLNRLREVTKGGR